jgi:Flp pilus assembly protein TadD
MIRSLSSINEHVRAADLAKALLAEAPDLLGVQKCYCSVLSSAGRSKEAEKFVKDNLKKNKSSPDADALAAYLLWIEGKTTSAGAYAAKAVKGDPNNTTAMEILAYCLVEKGKTSEAKIVAGAINEKEPGNPAVVRILDMCRISG